MHLRWSQLEALELWWPSSLARGTLSGVACAEVVQLGSARGLELGLLSGAGASSSLRLCLEVKPRLARAPTLSPARDT
ncbi:UNVERIFIED_CONTAM: hypothetical protein Sradi_6234800 [Sesamum radiatum]|uniref:Uncharacterized protein n=1 Tax=Sesamum radiatum TaxID=300843 RepID=A0AAW2KBR1_SESRA